MSNLYSFASSAASSVIPFIGAGESPQLPFTSVVTPCLILLSALEFTNSEYSEWECMSMNPGLTTNPFAFIILFASSELKSPISNTLPLLMPISALNHGLPVPSTRCPFLITTSNKKVASFSSSIISSLLTRLNGVGAIFSAYVEIDFHHYFNFIFSSNRDF